MNSEYIFRLESSLFFGLGRSLQKGFSKRSLKHVEIEVRDSELKITTDRGGSVIPCRGEGNIYARLSATAFIDLVKTRYREAAPSGEMWIKFNIDSARVSVEGGQLELKR